MRRIFLGFACNNGCVFCAQANDRAAWMQSPARDVAAIEASIDALVGRAPGETVAFVGGEPTVHDELPRWIARAVERGASRVLVQTNARRLAYAKYAEELAVAARPAKLALDVSLQGSSREMHEHLTRAPGSFAQTVLGLRHARGAAIATAVTTVVTRANYRHLVDVVRLAHASGATAIRIVDVADVRSASVIASRPPLVPPDAMVAPRLAAAREVARELGIALVCGDVAAGEQRFAGGSVTLVGP